MADSMREDREHVPRGLPSAVCCLSATSKAGPSRIFHPRRDPDVTRGKALAFALVWGLALFSGLSPARGQATKVSPPSQPGQAGRSGASAQAESDFARARQLAGEGSLEAAIEAARAGLKIEPHSRKGLDLLGILSSQHKDYAEAEAAFRAALKLDPRSSQTHNNLGITYVAEGKLDLAEREFRTTLRLDPKNRAANYNLGVIELGRNHAKEAIALLGRVQPTDSTTLFNLSQAYFLGGDKAKGIQTAKAVSAETPGDVRLHFTLGVMLARQKLYDEAAHEFELADSLRPGTFEILHDLGEAYLRQRESARADAMLNRALALEPDSADTMYLLAQAYSDENKDLEGLELLVKAHRLAPDNADIVFLMARLSMKNQFYEDAIQVLEPAVKIAPKRADLHAALGESHFMAGHVDKALAEFEILIKLDPSAASYTFMGLCYRHLGRFDEAQKYFEEGLRLDPHNAACLFNLGYIANKRGDYTGAEKLMEQALAVDPKYGDALYELGSAKIAEKKYEEALPLLRRCVALNTKESSAYYKLARAERAMHQMQAAERDFKIFETLSKDPAGTAYPLQHLFDYLGQRVQLTSEQKAQDTLQDLAAEVERHPERPQSLYLLAEAYLKAGRLDDATKTIARLDQVSGGDVRTEIGAGVLLARFHLYPGAIQHFQNALQADPSSDEAKYNLADASFRMRDYPRALEYLQQVSPAAQDDSYLALLGDTDSHLGRTAEAEDIFQKAIARNPDNDHYYLLLALAQMRGGEIDKARDTLKRGITRMPDSGSLYWGMGVLSVIEGRNGEAENNFKKSVDLLPQQQSGYSTLGIFYYSTGQIAQAREMLQRYTEIFPHGPLDVSRLQQTLDAAPPGAAKPLAEVELPPQARQRFLAMALALQDQAY